MVDIAAASIATAIVAYDLGARVNEFIVENILPRHLYLPIPQNGHVINKKPLLRDSIIAFIQHQPGVNVYNQLTDEECRQFPHIQQICEYARDHRPGFYSYYWIHRLAILNKIYIDWLHTLPHHSHIHQAGNYAQVFVELHLKFFHNGLYGRARDRYSP
jgi:hypothetical protein